MSRIITLILIVGIFGTSPCAFAQMSSPNFEIRWDSIGAGGDDNSSSSSYLLRDTAGNVGIGVGSSANYELRAGYRSGILDSFIEFSFFSQNNSVVETATGLIGTTISCVADDFTAGDMIALVQDRGEAQVAAIGQIVSVGPASFVVDQLKDGGVSPAIDGVNDFVYLLDGSSADLGTLTSLSVQTAIVGMEVTTDAGGYVVQVSADGDLRAGTSSLSAVADGAITAGSEEYGGRSSDVSLIGSTFDSADTAFSTGYQDVADSSVAIYNERNFLTLKGSIDGGTQNGSYVQELTLIVSGTY